MLKSLLTLISSLTGFCTFATKEMGFLCIVLSKSGAVITFLFAWLVWVFFFIGFQIYRVFIETLYNYIIFILFSIVISREKNSSDESLFEI